MKEIFSEIKKSKLFWLGLTIKLVFAFCFASKFLTDLFLPFVDFYVSTNDINPYQHFFLEQKAAAFPYPVLMLWILAIPYSLYILLAKLSIFLAIFSLKIVILIADFAIFLILLKWLKQREKAVIIFYWLSPVLIYINYIHSQLDAIPIAFLFVSLFLLFKERIFIAAIFLSLAIACKTHIILAAPFFLIYLCSKHIKFIKILSFILFTVAIFIAFNIVYLSSPEFISMVFLNKEQGKIFASFYQMHNDLLFFFIPAAYLLLLIKALSIKGYNRDIFIMFLGFAFGVINIFTPPMQGWYYWIIPFFSYFYIKQKNSPNYLFYFLQIAYFIHFALIKNSDFLEVFQLISPNISILNNPYHTIAEFGFNADQVSSLSFTCLQTILLLNCFWIYRDGISNYLKHRLTSKPYLVGISGNSGVGKSSLVNIIKNIFDSRNITSLCGDDMHKWERGHDKWSELTHLNPSANNVHDEISLLKALKNSKKIFRKEYNHENGKFTEAKEILPNRIVILEGLHSFYIEAVRKLFDVKIFIKPEENIQKHWKIIRDQDKRGHSKEKILEQIKKRENDSQKFILSQEKFADILIEFLAVNEIKNIGDKDEEVELKVKLSFSNNIDVGHFILSLTHLKSLNIVHNYDNEYMQSITCYGNAKIEDFEEIYETLLAKDFEELNFLKPKFENNLNGFLQIFLAFYIIQTEAKDGFRNC